ncbi:MAG: diguanylate cyclase [Quinella sp. 2Q5]|nr:diguanylate cyclase [Quinella sp. 2Q5]
MTEKIFPPPIAICVAAVAMNLFGAMIARTLELELYLDTGGTIFVAMLSGYVPGAAVGFATNLLGSFVNESEMYYCSISIVVALLTTFLARRGVFGSLPRTLTAIPALAFVTATLTLFIEKFLFSTGVVAVLGEIEKFPTIFLRELVDKGFLVLIMFVAIKFVPPAVKARFRSMGQRQAPLSKEMRRAVYRRKCPSASLRTRVLLMLMLTALFIAASISLITYRIFEQAAFNAQVKVADSLLTVAVAEIDPARVDDFTSRGRSAEGYAAVAEKLRTIKHSNTDIKFLRVYRISDEGCRVVFDADGAAVGEIFDVLHPNRDDFLAGRPVPPIVDDLNGEKLLVVCKPVYDAAGKCQCYVAADFSAGLLSDYGRAFISRVLALFSGCFVFIFVVGTRFVESNIILPVSTMEYCAKNFLYDSEDRCANNIEQLKRLEIHTGDEIENLYRALLKTTQDVLNYLEKFRHAKRQAAAMDELAHKDSLTGVKNKVAYDEATAALDEKISAGSAKFAIVMIDVNYLKKINDTYGHERGNIYLMNAVKLICAVFGADNVYRIGGDEFVVILQGDKVSLVGYFVKLFMAETDRKNFGDLQPWERVSAAAGAANFSAGDNSAEEVFKRADALMYENKLAMKAARTD